MRKNAILMGMGLLVVLFFAGNAARLYQLNFVDKLSAILYDYSLQLTMPHTPDERIVILDIDEKSLKEEGRWPWSRDRLSLLMDKLFDKYGIAVVGFDVVFAEKDESSGLNVLQKIAHNQLKSDAQFHQVLAQLSPQLEYDKQFAASIEKRKVVLGYYLSGIKGSISGALPQPVVAAETFKGMPIGFSYWSGYGANLPGLQKAAASAGHFNPLVDIDGIVRRVPMIAEYGGEYYESLSLAVVRTLFDQPRLLPGFTDGQASGYGGLECLEIESAAGKLKIPVDNEVAALIPYRGAQGSFRYISVTDVLHDRVPPAALKNKIVLVGTTAPGLMDMRATPVSEVYPGVEIHANMISGILDQNLKEQPGFVRGAEVLWLLLTGIVLSLLLPALSPSRAMLLSSVALLSSIGASFWMWSQANLVFPFANSLVMILLLFAMDMSYGYFKESRTRRKITGLFGQYVPSELVEEMARHPESVSMQGESREMTVLFSDVRSFTTISEGLDARELTLLMNEFLTPLSRIVYQHRGTIDKYMGDCIMAFWGAPLPDSNHAKNAILAGLEMLATLPCNRTSRVAVGQRFISAWASIPDVSASATWAQRFVSLIR
jgi:adenylate cyclase